MYFGSLKHCPYINLRAKNENLVLVLTWHRVLWDEKIIKPIQ